MPRGDGTGPDGTYKNCMPTGNTSNYGMRGRGNRRGTPGMGGRGRGYMNMFYETGQPRWQRGGYQPSIKEENEVLKKHSELLSKIADTLDALVKKLEK